MAKINFYVRSKEKGQPATVYLRYSESRDVDCWIPTPEKAFPEHWSSRTGGFKQNIVYSTSFTEKSKVDIEGRFIELKQHISAERLRLTGAVTKEWIKSIVAKFYNRTVGEENLNSYIDRFIIELESGKRLSKGKRYKFSTIKTIRDSRLS